MDDLRKEIDALKLKVQGNGKLEGSLEFRIVMLEASHRETQKEIAEIKGTLENSIKKLEQTIDKRMERFEGIVSKIGWTVILAVLGALIGNVLI